ncbi:MAG TPA: DNA (cytosine-5-)-methyltransferase, partial [Jiangellaceae bacterium]
MRVLSLCSGVGGLDRGLEAAGMKVVGLCEIDPTCRDVLARHWPDVPCHDDIRTMDGKEWRGRVDVVAGGSPCTDLSVAGRRAGLVGEHSRIFWDFCRVADQSAADWVLFENVAGLLSSNEGEDFAAVLWGLTGFRPAVPADGWRTIGMCVGPHRTATWRLLDARWFGVPQRRRRVYVVAGARGVCGPEVLVEPESCGWHPHPRRQTGTGPASTLGGSARGVGDLGSREEFVGSLTAMDGWERPDNAHAEAGWLTVGTLQSGPHGQRLDADSVDQYVVGTLAASELVDAGGGTDEAGHLITEVVDDIAAAVTAKWAKGTGGPSGDECQNLIPFVKRAHANADGDESWDESEVAPTLNGFDNASAVRSTVLALQENTRDEMRLYE